MLGTAGDSLRYHRNQSFSTQDEDNDNSNKNCAQKRHGAWWYKKCYHSNLNGLYHHINPSTNRVGMSWKTWRPKNYSLKSTEMKIRPINLN